VLVFKTILPKREHGTHNKKRMFNSRSEPINKERYSFKQKRTRMCIPEFSSSGVIESVGSSKGGPLVFEVSWRMVVFNVRRFSLTGPPIMKKHRVMIPPII
jgi:hypothetical protein